MRYAIVRNQIVESVIIWDGESAYSAPEGTTLVPTNGAIVGPGYSYVNGEFVAPAAPAEEPEL